MEFLYQPATVLQMLIGHTALICSIILSTFIVLRSIREK